MKKKIRAGIAVAFVTLGTVAGLKMDMEVDVKASQDVVQYGDEWYIAPVDLSQVTIPSVEPEVKAPVVVEPVDLSQVNIPMVETKEVKATPQPKVEPKVEQKKKEVKPAPAPSRGGEIGKGRKAGEWMTVQATGYCHCKKCNGKWAGQATASGAMPRVNHTIAVDPRLIKLGSHVEIEGLGVYKAEDTGGAIKGKKIDIFFGSHSEALKWGRRNVRIRVLK